MPAEVASTGSLCPRYRTTHAPPKQSPCHPPQNSFPLGRCNAQGKGALPAPGLAGLQPGSAGGTLIMNSSGTAGRYSRSRGHGADDILRTSAGLWIASDNLGGGTSCGGVSGFAGICFLPYG